MKKLVYAALIGLCLNSEASIRKDFYKLPEFEFEKVKKQEVSFYERLTSINYVLLPRNLITEGEEKRASDILLNVNEDELIDLRKTLDYLIN